MRMMGRVKIILKKTGATIKATWLSVFLLLMAMGLMVWAGADPTGAIPFIQAATLLVVAWYAWKTHELTQEMKEQTKEMRDGLAMEQHKARVSFATEVERFDPAPVFEKIIYDTEGARVTLKNTSENVATNVHVRPWTKESREPLWQLRTVPNGMRSWERGASQGFVVERLEPDSKRLDIDLEFQFFNARSQQRVIRYRIVNEQVHIIESFTSGVRDTRATDEQPELIRGPMPTVLLGDK